MTTRWAGTGRASALACLAWHLALLPARRICNQWCRREARRPARRLLGHRAWSVTRHRSRNRSTRGTDPRPPMCMPGSHDLEALAHFVHFPVISAPLVFRGCGAGGSGYQDGAGLRAAGRAGPGRIGCLAHVRVGTRRPLTGMVPQWPPESYMFAISWGIAPQTAHISAAGPRRASAGGSRPGTPATAGASSARARSPPARPGAPHAPASPHATTPATRLPQNCETPAWVPQN